ncbi:hypothetical protein NDU88_001131 [Pleurodeles waltl]|uniref:Uncharacterized protein n=1 Tax=Pleurodeles waltl TaxID=8319 RepID=A0AAV7THH0_PLEWA|nr:hypothetical protein NDU88_001131 [Pleurodeles waltl]
MCRASRASYWQDISLHPLWCFVYFSAHSAVIVLQCFTVLLRKCETRMLARGSKAAPSGAGAAVRQSLVVQENERWQENLHRWQTKLVGPEMKPLNQGRRAAGFGKLHGLKMTPRQLCRVKMKMRNLNGGKGQFNLNA